VSVLHDEGVPFRTVEAVLGAEGIRGADAAARAWARVWARVPIFDGRSFRDLVAWRDASLLWCVEAFLREGTAGPRCARTVEIALRLLESTGATEVDAASLPPADALLLARAATARGVLFHGPARATGDALPVDELGPPRRRLLERLLAPGSAPPPPAPLAGPAGAEPPVVVVADDEAALRALAPLAAAAADGLWRAVLGASLAELPRFETRRVLAAVAEAGARLRECSRRLRGTPGLADSYVHRGVRFADLAARDLPALLEGRLPRAVRLLESAVELLSSWRPCAVLVDVRDADERRTLVHAATAAGVATVVLLRNEAAAEPFRADGGPRPATALAWEPGSDPALVVARLREAAHGRVEAR
jgi:hypothetical protein